MIFYFILAVAIARYKGYDTKNLHKIYALYPYYIVEGVFLFFQLNIILGNYQYVQYASVLKNLYIYSFLLAIIIYKLYNQALLGSFLILIGTSLNNIVIAANGGKMPVYATLSTLTGYFSQDALMSVNGIHILANSQTKLIFLADIIDVGFSILSIGDILIHSFTFVLVFGVLKARHNNTISTRN